MAQRQIRIFAEIKGNMSLYKNGPYIVERIYEGDDQAFSSLYERCRDKFFGFFRGLCSEQMFGNQQMFRFKKGGEYLDDLYQTSCLKLYNQIMTGKMFVQHRKIYLRGKDGSINQLTANLGTYLTSIGKLTLKEMERGESRYVSFDPFEKICYDDNDPEYEIDDLFKPVESEIVAHDTTLVVSIDPEFDDEAKFALVRKIVEEMESPCKEIFTFTYFSQNGKRLKGEEIAKKMGYASADVVKNQKSRCHKKFKAVYNRALSGIN